MFKSGKKGPKNKAGLSKDFPFAKHIAFIFSLYLTLTICCCCLIVQKKKSVTEKIGQNQVEISGS